MKFAWIICLYIALFFSAPNEETPQKVLDAWMEMQNAGTDEAIKEFINQYYSPAMIGKMNMKDHVAFYRQIIDEFGEVQKLIYQKEVDQPFKLKVQLLKKGVAMVPEPTPYEILVVEIDLDPEQPRYLKRGLGLGALICYIKR